MTCWLQMAHNDEFNSDPTVGMLIAGCVCSLWQVLVNDLKWSPAPPPPPGYDCTSCCYVTRGSIMRDQGERGSCRGGGVMNVGLFTVSPEGAGWANIYRCPCQSDNDREIYGRQDVLGRIFWKNSWRVVFYKHERCKLRYVVCTGYCIGFSHLSPVGDNIQLSNLLYIFTAPSCYCCLCLSLFFTSVVCFVFCLIFYRLDTSCT